MARIVRPPIIIDPAGDRAAGLDDHRVPESEVVRERLDLIEGHDGDRYDRDPARGELLQCLAVCARMKAGSVQQAAVDGGEHGKAAIDPGRRFRS